jgi:hypothetical protein
MGTEQDEERPRMAKIVLDMSMSPDGLIFRPDHLHYRVR